MDSCTSHSTGTAQLLSMSRLPALSSCTTLHYGPALSSMSDTGRNSWWVNGLFVPMQEVCSNKSHHECAIGTPRVLHVARAPPCRRGPSYRAAAAGDPAAAAMPG